MALRDTDAQTKSRERMIASLVKESGSRITLSASKVFSACPWYSSRAILRDAVVGVWKPEPIAGALVPTSTHRPVTSSGIRSPARSLCAETLGREPGPPQKSMRYGPAGALHPAPRTCVAATVSRSGSCPGPECASCVLQTPPAAGGSATMPFWMPFRPSSSGGVDGTRRDESSGLGTSFTPTTTLPSASAAAQKLSGAASGNEPMMMSFASSWFSFSMIEGRSSSKRWRSVSSISRRSTREESSTRWALNQSKAS